MFAVLGVPVSACGGLACGHPCSGESSAAAAGLSELKDEAEFQCARAASRSVLCILLRISSTQP